MTVDGIGPIGQVEHAHKGRAVKPAAQEKVGGDGIALSTEAQATQDVARARQAVEAVPQTRAEIVAAAKAKINDPAYLQDPKVLETVSERISSLLLG